jgi:hypothetical protein
MERTEIEAQRRAAAARILTEAEIEVRRLRDAVASTQRQMADTSGTSLATVWLSVEALRGSRLAVEKLLRDAQELADRALDAMDTPVSSNARPESGVATRTIQRIEDDAGGTKTGSDG